MDTNDPIELAARHGIWQIGAGQRTIAFTVVASGGTGLLNITATGHALKKGDVFSITGGAYAGEYRVLKIISANIIQVAGTFGATATGNLNLTAALDGFGFWVDAIPLTIAAITPDNSNVDTTSLIAGVFVVGRYYPIGFKSLRISAGSLTVVRKPIPTDLAYANR